VLKASRIYVAGSGGLVGSAIVRKLRAEGYAHVLGRTRAELDLRDPSAVNSFFERERPEYLFIAAARVGGILANSSSPVEFLSDNILIQTNLLSAAHRFGLKKGLFLGSSCIYPKLAPQPIPEDSLMTGPLEPTNQWYAIAKIAGIRLAQAYWQEYGMRVISPMPTNLYGPGDNFDLETSHVMPALLRRFHEAKIGGAPHVTVWGTGTPRREFLHVDDLADAALFLMLHYDSPEIINVGTGRDISIGELAVLVKDVAGYAGEIVFDPSRPDGTPRKVLDVTRLLAMGWRARISLRDGVASVYRSYAETHGVHA
jgi:GDP-L-fucose synthase